MRLRNGFSVLCHYLVLSTLTATACAASASYAEVAATTTTLPPAIAMLKNLKNTSLVHAQQNHVIPVVMPIKMNAKHKRIASVAKVHTIPDVQSFQSLVAPKQAAAKPVAAIPQIASAAAQVFRAPEKQVESAGKREAVAVAKSPASASASEERHTTLALLDTTAGSEMHIPDMPEYMPVEHEEIAKRAAEAEKAAKEAKIAEAKAAKEAALAAAKYYAEHEREIKLKMVAAALAKRAPAQSLKNIELAQAAKQEKSQPVIQKQTVVQAAKADKQVSAPKKQTVLAAVKKQRVVVLGKGATTSAASRFQRMVLPKSKKPHFLDNQIVLAPIPTLQAVNLEKSLQIEKPLATQQAEGISQIQPSIKFARKREFSLSSTPKSTETKVAETQAPVESEAKTIKAPEEKTFQAKTAEAAAPAPVTSARSAVSRSQALTASRIKSVVTMERKQNAIKQEQEKPAEDEDLSFLPKGAKVVAGDPYQDEFFIVGDDSPEPLKQLAMEAEATKKYVPTVVAEANKAESTQKAVNGFFRQVASKVRGASGYVVDPFLQLLAEKKARETKHVDYVRERTVTAAFHAKLAEELNAEEVAAVYKQLRSANKNKTANQKVVATKNVKLATLSEHKEKGSDSQTKKLSPSKQLALKQIATKQVVTKQVATKQVRQKAFVKKAKWSDKHGVLAQHQHKASKKQLARVKKSYTPAVKSYADMVRSDKPSAVRFKPSPRVAARSRVLQERRAPIEHQESPMRFAIKARPPIEESDVRPHQVKPRYDEPVDELVLDAF